MYKKTLIPILKRSRVYACPGRGKLNPFPVRHKAHILGENIQKTLGLKTFTGPDNLLLVQSQLENHTVSHLSCFWNNHSSDNGLDFKSKRNKKTLIFMWCYYNKKEKKTKTKKTLDLHGRKFTGRTLKSLASQACC